MRKAFAAAAAVAGLLCLAASSPAPGTLGQDAGAGAVAGAVQIAGGH